MRTTGARTAVAARAVWEERHGLHARRDRPRSPAAHRRGPAALCDRLAREAAALLARPHRGRAPILDEHERVDAVGGRRAARRPARARHAGPARPRAGPRARRARAGARRPAGLRRATSPGPGACWSPAPGAIRARRVRALFLCGLNEQVFPRPAAARPAALRRGPRGRSTPRRACGCALGDDHLDARALPALRRRLAADRPARAQLAGGRRRRRAGRPVAVRRRHRRPLLRRAARAGRAPRTLGAAGWPADEAPTAARGRAGTPRRRRRPRRRRPLGPLAPDVAAAVLPADRPVSATAIEAWVGCPVKWFVDRRAGPPGARSRPGADGARHRGPRGAARRLRGLPRPAAGPRRPARGARADARGAGRAHGRARDLGQPRAAAQRGAPARGRPDPPPRARRPRRQRLRPRAVRARLRDRARARSRCAGSSTASTSAAARR